MNKLTIVTLFIIALLVTGCGESGTQVISDKVVSQEPITLGFIGPLTGDAASYGLDEKAVVEIVLEDINSKGGINGRQVEVIFEDGRCNPKDASSAARKLVNIDKVEVILGGSCSGETLGAAPIAEEGKVVLMSAYSSNPDIKHAGDYVFRTSVVDDQGGEAMAKLVAKDYKKVAVLTENTDYAVAFGKIFEQEFENLGGEIVESEMYDQDSKDYRTQLTKIKSKKPEATVFNAQSGVSGGTAFVQAAELNVPGEYYGTFYTSGNDFKTKVGELGEGIRFIDAPILDKNDAVSADLLRRFEAKTGHAPSSQFEVGSRYDNTRIIVEAIEAVGYDGTKIKDYLYTVEFDGTLGNIKFDSFGEPVGIEYVGFKLKNGEQVPLEVKLSGEPVKIGGIAPLTGDATAYGLPVQKAAELAVEDVNAAGGINGRPLEIIWEDGKCNPKDSSTAAQKLINFDKVSVILGGLCSGETMGAAPIAERTKTILFSAASTSPDITNAGDYVFRNSASDAFAGKLMAEYVFGKDLKTAGILTENTDYALAWRGAFVDRFEELGGEVLADEKYNSEDSDYRTQLTKIKGSDPEALLLIPQTPAKGGLAVRQVEELSIDAGKFTNELLSNEEVISLYSEPLEGYVFVEPGFDREAPKAKAVFAKYKAATGEDAPWPYYIALADDGVKILAEAVSKYGDDTEKIKAFLYSIKGREGAGGVLNIDENGDAESKYFIKELRDGEIVKIGEA